MVKKLTIDDLAVMMQRTMASKEDMAQLRTEMASKEDVKPFATKDDLHRLEQKMGVSHEIYLKQGLTHCKYLTKGTCAGSL